MSASASQSTDSPSFAERTVSHTGAAMIQKHGGSVDKAAFAMKASDRLQVESSADVETIINSLEQQDALTFDGQAGNQKLTTATGVGNPPEVVTDHYPDYTPHAHTTDNEDETESQGADFTVFDHIGESRAEQLHDAGYDTYTQLSQADPAALSTEVPGIPHSLAEDMVKNAINYVDASDFSFRRALAPYTGESFGPVGMGHAQGEEAVVMDLNDVRTDVGRPLYIVDDSRPVDECHVHSLPILEDVGHPHVQSAEGMIDPIPTDLEEYDCTNIERLGRLLAENMAVGLIGPSGVAKNYTVDWLHRKTNRVVNAMDMTGDTESEDLISQKVIGDDGTFETEDKPLKLSMLHGWTFVINEYNLGDQRIHNVVQTLIQDGHLVDPNTQEVIIPHPEFRLIVTMNPPTPEFRGTDELNKAHRDRFHWVRFERLGLDDEVDLLDSKYNARFAFVDREDIRKAAQAARISRQGETYPTITTRKLEHVIEDIGNGAPVAGAIRGALRATAGQMDNPADAWEAISDTF